jgi:membrane-associated phospholipid phosphatase
MRLVALITAILALFAVIFYIDMPLAEHIHTLGLWRSLRSVSLTRAPVMLAAGMAAVVLGCLCLVLRLPFARLCRSATLAGFATLLSFVLVKGFLKEIFGRAFPYIVLGHGSDAFHWFSALPIERSFPSTHAAELAAMLTVFWMRHPRWKVPYALVALAMNTTMLLGEWHFLSDILAGTALGIANATLVMVLARRIGHRLPETELAQWNAVARPAQRSHSRRRASCNVRAPAHTPVRELR